MRLETAKCRMTPSVRQPCKPKETFQTANHTLKHNVQDRTSAHERYIEIGYLWKMSPCFCVSLIMFICLSPNQTVGVDGISIAIGIASSSMKATGCPELVFSRKRNPLRATTRQNQPCNDTKCDLHIVAHKQTRQSPFFLYEWYILRLKSRKMSFLKHISTDLPQR